MYCFLINILTLETLNPSLITIHVNSGLVNNESVLYFREYWAQSFRARRYITRPSSVTHAEKYWLTSSYVARFTFIADDGTVTSSTSVEYRHISVLNIRKGYTLRC